MDAGRSCKSIVHEGVLHLGLGDWSSYKVYTLEENALNFDGVGGGVGEARARVCLNMYQNIGPHQDSPVKTFCTLTWLIYTYTHIDVGKMLHNYGPILPPIMAHFHRLAPR